MIAATVSRWPAAAARANCSGVGLAPTSTTSSVCSGRRPASEMVSPIRSSVLAGAGCSNTGCESESSSLAAELRRRRRTAGFAPRLCTTQPWPSAPRTMTMCWREIFFECAKPMAPRPTSSPSMIGTSRPLGPRKCNHGSVCEVLLRLRGPSRPPWGDVCPPPWARIVCGARPLPARAAGTGGGSTESPTPAMAARTMSAPVDPSTEPIRAATPAHAGDGRLSSSPLSRRSCW
jgi:hypothetical protein